MNPIREKIEKRLDELEAALKKQKHLDQDSGIQEVIDLIGSISKFWRILDDDQRDYVIAARIAVEEQMSWE